MNQSCLDQLFTRQEAIFHKPIIYQGPPRFSSSICQTLEQIRLKMATIDRNAQTGAKNANTPAIIAVFFGSELSLQVTV